MISLLKSLVVAVVAGLLLCGASYAAPPFDRTYLVKTTLSNGDQYQQYWSFDGESTNGSKMRVKIVSGPHGGLEDTLALFNQQISPGVWFINWLAINDNAAKGNTISYVVDFNQGKVLGFFTNNPKSPGGVRPFETAVGTISER